MTSIHVKFTVENTIKRDQMSQQKFSVKSTTNFFSKNIALTEKSWLRWLFVP